MNVAQLKQSRYLTRADVGTGVLVTISDVTQENVAKEGAPEELRWIVHFNELEKGLVLNNTNGMVMAKLFNSDESDDWRGHKVVLYDDPNVSFGGKLVGGIRVRAPRNQPPASAGIATGPLRPLAGPEGQGSPTPQPARRSAPVNRAIEPAPQVVNPEDDTPF